MHNDEVFRMSSTYEQEARVTGITDIGGAVYLFCEANHGRKSTRALFYSSCAFTPAFQELQAGDMITMQFRGGNDPHTIYDSRGRHLIRER